MIDLIIRAEELQNKVCRIQRFSAEQIVRFYLVVSWSRAAHFGAFHNWGKWLHTDRCLVRFDSDMFDGVGDKPDKPDFFSASLGY